MWGAVRGFFECHALRRTAPFAACVVCCSARRAPLRCWGRMRQGTVSGVQHTAPLSGPFCTTHHHTHTHTRTRHTLTHPSPPPLPIALQRHHQAAAGRGAGGACGGGWHRQRQRRGRADDGGHCGQPCGCHGGAARGGGACCLEEAEGRRGTVGEGQPLVLGNTSERAPPFIAALPCCCCP